MTRTELHNLLDDTVVYDVYKMLKSIGGDCKCSVDKDMVPHLSIDTGDDQCRIRVSTRAITDNNGEQGWEFIPTVVNASISETIDIDTQGDIRRRFKRWATIAEAAEKLFEIELYPGYYKED